MNAINNNKKQQGFGIPSILIGLAVVAIIGTAAISSFQSNVDQAKIANAKTFFTDGLNNAVQWCYTTNGGDLSGCGTDTLIAMGGIDDNHRGTEWDTTDAWGAVATADNVTITYNAKDEATATILATALPKTNASITSATATPGDADGELIVVYGPN